jgi:hypothetical protein
MRKRIAATVSVLLVGGLAACASEYAEPDARPDASEFAADDASGGDDGPGEDAVEGSDPGSEVPPDVVPDVPVEVVPDVPVEVPPDVPADVEPEVPLPVSCERTGARDCSAYSESGRCPDGPTEFGGDVNGAIDATIAGHPEWFVTDGYPGCCPLIQPANVNDYMQAVSDLLDAAGLCASGPGEELNVKFNNECSEAWDIVANPDAETNLVRRHYVGNCFPSFF